MRTSTREKRWRWTALVSAAIALLLVPIRTQILPSIRVVVTDAAGAPVPRAIVRQIWFYRLADPIIHEASAPVDSSGVMSFPARSITASAVERAIASVQEWSRANYHRTQTPYGAVTAWSPGYRAAARGSQDINGDSLRLTLDRDSTWKCP